MGSKIKRYRRKKRLERKFLDLSWFLLECKIMYYGVDHKFSSKFDKRMNCISDSQYDLLERKYKRLCKLLNRPNTVQSMVGIDQERPSVQCAIRRLAKIDMQIRKKEFTGCCIRSRLGITKGASK